MKQQFIGDYIYRIKAVLSVTQQLSISQARRINHDGLLARGAIKQMVREGDAFYSKKKDYILTNPRFKPRENMSDAVEALIPFLDTINLSFLYVPDEPALIGFTRAKTSYEIVVCRNSSEIKEKAGEIEKNYAAWHKKADTDFTNTHYIFTVFNETTIDYMPDDLTFNYVFCVVNYGLCSDDDLREPDISFFAPQREDPLNDSADDETDFTGVNFSREYTEEDKKEDRDFLKDYEE